MNHRCVDCGFCTDAEYIHLWGMSCHHYHAFLTEDSALEENKCRWFEPKCDRKQNLFDSGIAINGGADTTEKQDAIDGQLSFDDFAENVQKDGKS